MQKGFLGSLFDLSFTSFVTPRLIKVLYVMTLVILAVAYVVIAVSIFTSGGTTRTDINGYTYESGGGNIAFGIVWLLVLGPLFLIFYTLLYRVVFELVMVIFRIFENTRDQLALASEHHGPAAEGVGSQPVRPDPEAATEVSPPADPPPAD